MNFYLEIIPFEERGRSIPTPTPVKQESSYLCNSREESQNFILSEKKARRRRNQWKSFEQYRYAKFLQKHRNIFISLTREQKKNVRCNVMMSKAVQTRTAIQCHSHHQKMMIKYHSIDQIIRRFGNIKGKGAKSPSGSQLESLTPDNDIKVVKTEDDKPSELIQIKQVDPLECGLYQPEDKEDVWLELLEL